jgi:hypothetical protein
MLTFTPQACEAVASICGCQSNIRGTITQCNVTVDNNISDQKPTTNHHNQRVNLTYQRRPVAASVVGRGCSDMQIKYQGKVEVHVKLSPPSRCLRKNCHE